ncbi:MAG TPA: hypothetical protein VJ782_10420 [Aeromicrobium sp.]|nr:hypothetical protein [Aeromicrobium sp.]
MSAIVSGAAAAALTAGLAAGLAFESAQVQPHVLQVQHQGPPGPALIEKFEASAAGPVVAAHAVAEAVPDISDVGGTPISDICPGEEPAPMALDAVLCTLGSQVESLLETLLAGIQPAEPR